MPSFTAQITDIRTPLRLTIRYRVPAYALVAGDPVGGERLVFIPPQSRHPLRSPAFAPYLDAADQDERRHDIQLGAPRMMEVVETVVLPRGFGATRLPRERALDGPAASLKANLRTGTDGLVSDYTLVVKRRAVAAADYGNFRDVVEAKALADDPVILEKEVRK